MDKRTFLLRGASLAVLSVTTACTTTTPDAANPAARRRSIDAAAEEALARLYQQAPNSKELVSQARGVLMFPNVVSAGFLVGGAAGDGVLRKGGRSVRYHRMTEGSVGLLAGAQSQALFVLFMTEDALDRFEASRGWTAGVDGSIALLNVGAAGTVTTLTARQPIVGFVLVNAGLMADVSLSGAKITPLEA